MKIIVFGATGMVGHGVLRECLLDPEVQSVLAIGRAGTGIIHPKLLEIAHPDLWHYQDIEAPLTGFDACFFCLGVSSNGISEESYERITYGITMAAAEMLCRLNPRMIFIFVSGAGADSTEKGRLAWARVKGKTENALLRLPFKGAYVFRPGFIQPLHGARSRTNLYRVFYSITKPILPLLRWAFPRYILTTEQIGRAMLSIARAGYSKHVLESSDIYAAYH